MKDLELQKSKSTLMTGEKTVCTKFFSSGTSGKRQLDLKDVSMRKNKLSTSLPRHKSITESFGIFLTQDMRPYSVVEIEGFRAMVYKLESRYDIQSWRYFANKVIPNLYEKHSG